MEYNLPNFYKNLQFAGFNPDEWNNCPKCDAKPRVWCFNNGRHATCKCYGVYDKKVEAISVVEYHNKNDGDMSNYPHNQLRDNWNMRCENTERLMKISILLKLFTI